MSHIETGNTKLSLPVLAALSVALGVSADELLFEQPSGSSKTFDEIQEILARCSAQEVKMIAELVRAAKTSFDKYLQ